MVARHLSLSTQVTRAFASSLYQALSLSRHSLQTLLRALVPRPTQVWDCDKQLLEDSLPLLPGVVGQLSWSPLQVGVTRITLRSRGNSWRCGGNVAQRYQPTSRPSASILAARDSTPTAWPIAPRWPPHLCQQRASFSTKAGRGSAWLF